MKKTIIFLFAFFIFIRISGQGTDCGSAQPFCIGSNHIYPASTNVPTLAYGTYPNFGCMCTLPNPAWYYMKVATSGNFVINISYNQAFVDVDFICWGPFTSPAVACKDSLLTGNCSGCNPDSGCPNYNENPTFYPSGNITDCSYSANNTEDCHINNALSGQYYILLITNYSNITCNLLFTQTNAGQPGAGTTDCSIFSVPIHNNGPLCVGDTLKLFADTVQDATNYFWYGPSGWVSNQQYPIIPNVNTANAGSYYCQAYVNGQYSVFDSIIVIVHSTIPTPSSTITGNTNVNQGQQNVTYSVPLIPDVDSYIWELPSGAIGTSTTNSITVNYSNNAQSGFIKVKGHNSCGDGSSSSSYIFVHLNIGTGVYSGGDIIVYPSPASLSITISYYLKKTQDFTLDVYDITGRKIKELVNGNQHLGEHHLTLDTSELIQGIYLLKATGDDSFNTLKFSVVH